MSESPHNVFAGSHFVSSDPQHVSAFLRPIPSSDASAKPMLAGVPTLLDCLRIEKEALIRRGCKPVRLLMHGDCAIALEANARAEGELDEAASPARILDLPLFLGNKYLSVDEGARILCEGDALHLEIEARRAAAYAEAGITPSQPI
jgi:hypothetical protein